MCGYLSRMTHKFSLFDAPLVYNFSSIFKTEHADLTKVFDNTLVKVEPVNAVVGFPDTSSRLTSPDSRDVGTSSQARPPAKLPRNHDIQPYQALEASGKPFSNLWHTLSFYFEPTAIHVFSMAISTESRASIPLIHPVAANFQIFFSLASFTHMESRMNTLTLPIASTGLAMAPGIIRVGLLAS